jgi:3' terminal RNA ribose 2'-O-methyltransferase Hen1
MKGLTLMQITFVIQGENAGLVSYFFGKHPDNPFTRDTDFGTIEFKFIEYRDDYVKGFIAFHADGLSMVQNSEYKGLEQYINDREFALSTIFLTNVRRAIGHVLSREYENINKPYHISVELGPISTTLPDEVITQLFEPLGYETGVRRVQVDYEFDVDSGKVVSITLKNHTDVVTLFRQLYVLIPVLDNYKHYAIAKDEAEKLLRYGEGWLERHPHQYFITKRYVRYKQALVQSVLDKLTPETLEADSDDDAPLEKKIRLGELRYQEFAHQVEKLGVRQVVDMGAGEGRLLELLVQNRNLNEVIACEPSEWGLTTMHRKLSEWKRRGEVAVEPEIIQSSLFYRDERLRDKECIVLCEVIEHIDRDRVDGVMRTLLSFYRPRYLMLSTPNVEYNAVYEMGDNFRHPDHRFEMTRSEFEAFVTSHGKEHGYTVDIKGIGEAHPVYGQPTQMAILKRG